MTEGKTPLAGFHHHHTDAELRAYRRLTAEQKLAWLEDAWRLTVDFLPKDRINTYLRFRRAEI
jgi:hypothetical protein